MIREMKNRVRPATPFLAIRAAAYRKAKAIRNGGHRAFSEAVDKFGKDYPAASKDAGWEYFQFTFRAYRKIGGSPQDLLAAVHDGADIHEFLALPWPPPRYIKKYKQWADDEPIDVRRSRAKHIQVEATSWASRLMLTRAPSTRR